MPTLPTIEVSNEHFARLVDALPGETTQEKTDFYLSWLVNGLIDMIYAHEVAAVDEQVRAYRDNKVQEILDSLPPRPGAAASAPDPSTAT